MLPRTLPIEHRFKLVAELGFDGVEIQTTRDDAVMQEIRAAAAATGVPVHAVMDRPYPNHILAADPAGTEAARQNMMTSMTNAAFLGADTVLLIPGVVVPGLAYKDAWARSQAEIRRMIPAARELGLTIAVENVYFPASPLEFVRFIDEIDDPNVQVYLDTGNAALMKSNPEDWILTLGSRIRRMHLKDFDSKQRNYVRLGDGEVDFVAVRRAIEHIGYTGYVTVEINYACPELDRGDVDYLSDLARRVHRILGP